MENYYIPQPESLLASRAIIYHPKKKGKEWYFLPYAERFGLPKKLYGSATTIAERIVKRYLMDKEQSLGVAFIGIKGSGKTELAKLVCNMLLEQGYPVIFISGISPDVNLIEKLDELRDVVIFIDEFGKLIPHNLQGKMLTFLSDPKKTHKLFIITENKVNYLSMYLYNRPGRLKYFIEFEGLTKEVIEEYCKDHGVDEKFTKELIRRAVTKEDFTFDHLKAIVEEKKLFPDSTLDQIVELLNVKLLKKPEYPEIVEIYDKDGNVYEFEYTTKTIPTWAALKDCYNNISIKLTSKTDSKTGKEKKINKIVFVGPCMNNIEVEYPDEETMIFKYPDLVIVTKKTENPPIVNNILEEEQMPMPGSNQPYPPTNDQHGQPLGLQPLV